MLLFNKKKKKKRLHIIFVMDKTIRSVCNWHSLRVKSCRYFFFFGGGDICRYGFFFKRMIYKSINYPPICMTFGIYFIFISIVRVLAAK